MVPRFRGVVQGWHRIKYVMSIEGSKAVQTRDGHRNRIQLRPYTLRSMYGHSPSPYKPVSCRPASPAGTVTVIRTAIIRFITGTGSYELSYNLLQIY